MNGPPTDDSMSSSQEPPTPIERAWGERLALEAGPDCLEAPALIELAERGPKSPRWSQGMDHITRCGSCRERYRETLTLTKRDMAPRTTAFPAASQHDHLSRPSFRARLGRVLVPAMAGAALACLLLWLFLVKPADDQARQQDKQIALLVRERDEKTLLLDTLEKQLAAKEKQASDLQAENARQRTTLTKNQERQQALALEASRLQQVVATLTAEKERLERFVEGQQQRSRSELPQSLRGDLDARDQKRLAHVPLPDLRYLASAAPGPVRGSAEPPVKGDITLLSPVATRVRPSFQRFRWMPTTTAGGSYRVTIADAISGETLFTGKTKDTAWTPPRPLPPGRTLRWWVQSGDDSESNLKKASRSLTAFIQTLSAKDALAVNRALDRIKSSTVEKAALLAHKGLFAEASILLEHYLLQHPMDDSARSLAQRIQSEMNR
jgi:hypothetical protein